MIVRELINIIRFEEADSGQIEAIDQGFQGAKESATQAGMAIGGFVTALGGMVAATDRVDKLQASLETMLGSQEKSRKEFQRLSEFAKTTPFSLEQSVQGAIRLRQRGIQPTNETLKSFGDLAVQSGKDMQTTIEAVADASVGEFERLKEFGISASKQGDQVSLTYKNTTRTIENSGQAITKALRNIAQQNAAGAMQARMENLMPQVIALRDEVVKFFDRVKDNSAFITSATRMTNAIKGLFTGSGDLAETLGDALALQLEVVAALFKAVGGFIFGVTEVIESLIPGVDNTEVAVWGLVAAFSAWLALQVKNVIFGIIGGLQQMEFAVTANKSAFQGLTASSLAAWAAIAAGAIAAFLLIEDFVAFLEGKDSLIGDMFNLPAFTAAWNKAAGIVLGLITAIGVALGVIFTATVGWVAAIGLAVAAGIGIIIAKWESIEQFLFESLLWIRNSFNQAWKDVSAALSNAFFGIINKIRQEFNDLIGSIKSGIDSVSGLVSKIPGVDLGTGADQNQAAALAGAGARSPALDTAAKQARQRNRGGGGDMQVGEIRLEQQVDGGNPDDVRRETRRGVKEGLRDMIQRASENEKGGPK